MPPGSFDGAISSPPYIDSVNSGQNGIDWEKAGRLDRTQESPNRHNPMSTGAMKYGEDAAQLGAMTEGDFDASISSPPFGQAQTGGGIMKAGYVNPDLRPGTADQPFDLVGERTYTPDTQGSTPGQLANMETGNFDGAVSSPPYENSINTERNGIDWEKAKKDYPGRQVHEDRIEMLEGHHNERRYGTTPGQLGQDTGDTFWAASRIILEQVFQALAPGAPAVWVVKNFVRDKKIVDFCGQWRQLCEAVGFVTLHEHRAWLVEESAGQTDLAGEVKRTRKERKSFFRRLAEKKGSPRIDWELVICMQKPLRIVE